MYGWRVLMCLSVYMFHFPPLFLCWDFFCVVDELQFSESVCRSPTVASNREQPQPRQHTTSCHQCNKAQTKLITCFSAFSHPSLQISSHQGATWHYYYCVLLILCLFLTHSLLQFPILCLAPTHLSYLSPLLSSPSVSLCVSLSVLTDSISCGLSRVTCLILFTGHMASPRPGTKKKQNTVDSGSFL